MLKTLHAAGLSSRQIAEKLPRCFTRNAVLGRIHRLQNAGEAPVQRKERTRCYGSMSATLDSHEDRYARGCVNARHILHSRRGLGTKWIDRHQIVPTEAAVTLFDLRYGVCRMPVGNHDGPVEGRLYCGAGTRKASSYCERCHRIAYQQRAA